MDVGPGAEGRRFNLGLEGWRKKNVHHHLVGGRSQIHTLFMSPEALCRNDQAVVGLGQARNFESAVGIGWHRGGDLAVPGLHADLHAAGNRPALIRSDTTFECGDILRLGLRGAQNPAARREGERQASRARRAKTAPHMKPFLPLP